MTKKRGLALENHHFFYVIGVINIGLVVWSLYQYGINLALRYWERYSDQLSTALVPSDLRPARRLGARGDGHVMALSVDVEIIGPCYWDLCLERTLPWALHRCCRKFLTGPLVISGNCPFYLRKVLAVEDLWSSNVTPTCWSSFREVQLPTVGHSRRSSGKGMQNRIRTSRWGHGIMRVGPSWDLGNSCSLISLYVPIGTLRDSTYTHL